MAKRRTFVDTAKRISYTFDRQKETVTAVSFEGEEVCESITASLVERLTAQLGGPIVTALLKGSKCKDLPLCPMFTSCGPYGGW